MLAVDSTANVVVISVVVDIAGLCLVTGTTALLVLVKPPELETGMMDRPTSCCA